MDLNEVMEKAIQTEWECKHREEHTLIIKTVNDIEQANFNKIEIESVTISSVFGNYDGPLPDLSSAVNIRQISIYRLCSWEEIINSLPPFAEEVLIVVPYNAAPLPLINPSLKRLVIEFRNTDDDNPSEKCSIDFSGIPNVEELSLQNAGNIILDNLTSLSNLKSLKCTKLTGGSVNLPNIPSLEKLMLTGSFNDFHVSELMPSLKEVYLSCDIRNINSLKEMPALELVALDCPKGIDLSVTDQLPNLKYLSCSTNSLITNTDNLLNRDNVKSIISMRDHQLDYIRRSTPSFNLYIIMRMLKQQDERIAKTNFESPLLRDIYNGSRQSGFADAMRRTKEQASMTKEQRLGRLLQADFEKEFFNSINPFNYRLSEYEVYFKEFYITNALDNYPFLKQTEKMRQQLLRESRPLSAWLKEFKAPGNILFLDTDLLTISIKLLPGNGEFTINTTDGRRYLQDSFKKHFRRVAPKILDGFDIESYNYIVNITQYYFSNLYIEHCVLPIIIAIKSIQDSIILRSDTVLATRFQDGKQTLICENQSVSCRVSKMNGFSRIVFCGKEDFHEDDLELLYCKNVEKIISAMVTK